LAQRSTQLVKPIQDKVAKAVQAVAETESLDMIFDKNSETIMLYANPRYDKSAAVITRLGLKPGVLQSEKFYIKSHKLKNKEQ
jgi:outer membrane protein